MHAYRKDTFAQYVKWMLENYAKTVDASYIQKKYPGVSPANQARKAITKAAQYNGVSSGAAAAAITALELSSLGPHALVSVPTIAAAVMANVAYTTRTQLRTTYDLSVIHGAPLSADDTEDCYIIFLTAMGVKLQELTASSGKPTGSQVVTYNVRKLLRRGLRRAIQEVLKKVGGTRLSRVLTERAAMRLLVPGINVPIAWGTNYYLTHQILNVADRQMRQRGNVVQPVIRLYKREPSLEKTAVVKALISVVDAGDPDGWADAQLDALRHCASTLSLTDADLAKLYEYFDRNIDDAIAGLPELGPKSRQDLVELCTAGAALYPTEEHDSYYSEALSKMSQAAEKPMNISRAATTIKRRRKMLA